MIDLKLIRYSIFITILFSCSLGILLIAQSVKSNDLLLGTDRTGTVSHYAGRMICYAVNKSVGDDWCRVVSVTDATHNLTNLQSGSLDLALVSSRLIYEAVSSTGRFKHIDIPFDGLRYIMPFYRLPISLIVRRDSKIQSFQDLVQKRINSGAPFSRNKHIFEELMTAMNWDESTFRVYQTLSGENAQDFIAFNNGTVQAMLHIGVHPDMKLKLELVNSGSLLLGVDGPAVKKLIDSQSGFYGCAIPAGTYSRDFAKLETLGIETQLITSEDLDDSTVQLVLDAVFKSKRQIREGHSSFLDSSMKFDDKNSETLVPHRGVGLYHNR